MVGIPGSGKSFFAEKFSEMFHAPYVSFEKIMEVGDGNTDSAAKYMTYLLHELIKTKQTLIVDGLADTRAQRAEYKHIAASAGYKPLFVWVQTDTATAKSRALKTSKDKGQRMSPADYDHISNYFVPLTAAEKPVVVSGKHTYATQAKVVLKHLATPRTQTPPESPPPERNEPTSRRNIIIR